MGVRKYSNKGVTYWMVDETLTMPDGTESRIRKRRIPTKEMALALAAKAKAAAFEGRFFEKLKPCLLTVAEAWAMYQPVTNRDNDAWRTDKGRADHLLQHLGPKRAQTLTEADIDAYRNVRLAEVSRKGGPPAPASLDREVELLKRMLNYAVRCGNPRTGTKWIEIRDKFTAACKAAGLSGVWFHDLRRSFVTNTRRIGVPESVVMRMSGHKTRAVFDRYNVVEAEDLREAVRRIEAGQQLRQESVKVRKK